MKILAIETSCDETTAAVIETNQHQTTTHNLLEVGNCSLEVNVLSNVIASQINIHKKFGGVFPEHASRAHTEKIIPVVEEAILQAERSPRTSGGRTSASRLDRVPGVSGTTRGLLNKIDLIAVTTGPGLIGSLLIGVNAAKSLAYANNLPIIGINHWLGHIYSCFAGEFSISNLQFPKNSKTQESEPSILKVNRAAERAGVSVANERGERLGPIFSLGKSSPVSLTDTGERRLPEFPALILIVSGGHTGLVLMKSHTEIIPLGETLDDAAGEAFDKVAKLLGLDYPGGPSIAKAAEQCHSERSAFRHAESVAYATSRTSQEILHCVQDDNIKFPRSMLDRKDYNFSFSGLKTAVLYKVKELKSRGIAANHYQSLVAHEFQQTVIDILVGKTIQAAYNFKPQSICLCGGVSANYELRQQLKLAVEKLPSKTSYHIPPMELTTDNAAMIGLAAAYHLEKATHWDNINANANLKL